MRLVQMLHGAKDGRARRMEHLSRGLFFPLYSTKLQGTKLRTVGYYLKN